jgi:hypothetical protein
MHLFYASSEISVLATGEAIRLIIQIPLRSERQTYTVYTPVSLPTWEPNLGKFIQVQAGEERLAVSSDRRNCMILRRDCAQNCREGVIMICVGIVPIADRAYDTCLNGLYFGTSQGYNLCTREIVLEDFRSVFRRLPFENSWFYAVAKLARVECPANLTKIEGTGVLQQPEGCDLFIEELMLPASRQFESRAEWSGPEVVVPQIPDLLYPREVSYIREHQELLEDIWDDWQIPEEGPAPVIAPMTMSELRQQIEARTQGRK